MEKVPQRFVSLAPSHTEILFALGLGDKVVGVTRYCNYPEEAKKKETVDGFATPDREKVIALEPDLILSFGTLQKPMVRELEERGQRVFWTYPHTVEDVLESFERIGKLTGEVAAARLLRKEVKERIETVYSRVKNIPEPAKPTVFRVMGSHATGMIGTVGGDAFQTEVYRLAGGRNIFADTKADYFEVDIETIRELDPDIIIVAGKDTTDARAAISRREGWEGLTAVKTGRIVVIPAELICRASPRLGLTIERLAKEFHPARFS